MEQTVSGTAATVVSRDHMDERRRSSEQRHRVEYGLRWLSWLAGSPASDTSLHVSATEWLGSVVVRSLDLAINRSWIRLLTAALPGSCAKRL